SGARARGACERRCYHGACGRAARTLGYSEPMRRLSLGSLLTLVNAGLVTAAVVCVVLAAAGLLRRRADEQTLARVGLAGSTALGAVERAGGDLSTSARLLAERPAL